MCDLLLFVLLPTWWPLLSCVHTKVCVQSVFVTCIIGQTLQKMSLGMLNVIITPVWPDTSWHSLPRPATQCGWAQVAKQQATRMSKALTWCKVQPNWQWQTWRTRGWQGVPQCRTTPLPLSNLVTHAAAAQQSLSSFSFPVPSCLQEEFPSQNTC